MTKKYPMLSDDIDEARLEEVGGKAYILEEILKRWPEAPIPEFKVHNIEEDPAGFKRSVYRASSILDILGGFGLTDSVIVNNNNKMLGYFQVIDPQCRYYDFAESIGVNADHLSIITQDRACPTFWALIMEHPNKEGLLLINYAQRPCGVLNMAGNTNTFDKVVPSIAIYDGKLMLHPLHTHEEHYLVEAVDTFNKLKQTGIISGSWTAIAELGLHHDHTDIFQLTPIKKRTAAHSSINPLIFGKMPQKTLPYIRLPSPEENMIKRYTAYPQSRIQQYVQSLDRKYPDGYIIETTFFSGYDSDGRQTGMEFDIVMKNAKAVLINTAKEPLKLLNHDISRLIYKTPCLIISQEHDFPSIKNHQQVRFWCDGAAYKIEKIN